MIPINIKLKESIQETIDLIDKMGNLTQSFPGEQGEMALYFILFVDKGAEEIVKALGENKNIEYAETAPIRNLLA